MKVFLDTVGLLAVWDVRDQWHSPATRVFRAMLAANVIPVSTTLVLMECANAASRRPFRASVSDLRRTLEKTDCLIHPDAADWAEAWRLYDAGSFGSAGLVDIHSILAMRRMGIARAFTNDRHFRMAGVETLF